MIKVIVDIENAINEICDVLESKPSLMSDKERYERLCLLNAIPFRELEGEDLISYRKEMRDVLTELNSGQLAAIIAKNAKIRGVN